MRDELEKKKKLKSLAKAAGAGGIKEAIPSTTKKVGRAIRNTAVDIGTANGKSTIKGTTTITNNDKKKR